MSRLSLEMVRVASPCTASWEGMTGDDQMRRCQECGLQVFNLSAMTREDAEALIEERTGRTCVRLYRRADGTVLTRDCPNGSLSWRKRLLLAAGVLAGGVLFVFTWAYLALGGSRDTADAGKRLRDIEPFHTIIEWFDPTPPPAFQVMGAFCFPEDPSAIRPPSPEPEQLPPPAVE